MMRIALSTGFGRLHLVTSAEWLSKAGIAVDLLCGWVPRNPDGWLVRLCSRIVGRDLSFGMKKRVINLQSVRIIPIPVAEFLMQGTVRLARVLHVPTDRVHAWAWRLFGFCSARHLKSADIFHCRSGAGRGGAIATARKRGMKIVVDHSIAHPAFMEEQLRAEYERNGLRFTFGMSSPFWRQVIEDCHEADVVLVNSFFVRDTFVQQGFDADKVKVVYLGEREDFIGLRKPKQNQGTLRLLFTGGFGFRKGGEYILEALKILKNRGVDYKMDFVGSYAEGMKLIKQYEQYKLPIVFHGPKPQDELKSFLANGDVYVFPSLAEGCAQSGMEAIAAGLCVIGTYESGFPIVNGENGYVVPSKNAEAIADRIEWLAANRAEIDRIGENAANLIKENYTWRHYAENVEKVYDELMAT